MKLDTLTTETSNDKTRDLDSMDLEEGLKVMNTEDAAVASAVRDEIPHIKAAIEIIKNRLQSGGRLIYMGAGSSGRIGLMDAVECPPTFGVSPDKVQGLLAGGTKAFMKAVEGAEDSQTMAQEDLENIGFSQKDVLVGLAASGRTPYVVEGIKYAKQKGAATVAVANNKASVIGRHADIAIEPVTGPEVLTGSTRLKAGTAQKMVVNMLSTFTMVGLGKVFKNYMVDLQITNEKLKRRSVDIVVEATGVEHTVAEQTLEEAEGAVKTAIVMILASCSNQEAKRRLEAADGHVREAIL